MKERERERETETDSERDRERERERERERSGGRAVCQRCVLSEMEAEGWDVSVRGMVGAVGGRGCSEVKRS